MEIDKNNAYTQEVQDIMGTPPSHIIRYGMSYFGIVLVIVLSLSYIIKYPDIIDIPCTVVADSPVVPIYAPKNIRLTSVKVVDKQFVKSGQVLVVFDDSAKYESIKILKDKLNQKSEYLPDAKDLKLGEIQTNYVNLKNTTNELIFFKKNKFHERKIKALNNKIKSTTNLKEHLNQQSIVSEKDSRLGEQIFKRDSNLYSKKGLTFYEYVNSERIYLKEQNVKLQAKSSLVNLNVQLDDIKQSIVELELDYAEKMNELSMKIEKERQQLLLNIIEWEKKSLLRAPIDGTVTFNTLLSSNSSVKNEEVILNIIPGGKNTFYCKLKIPVRNSGKIMVGQDAIVSFDSYMSTEYGTIKGKVHTISLVPDEKGFSAVISLPKILKTNYGYNLPFKQGITGIARIITKDYRLISRLFKNLDQVRSINNFDNK